MIEETYGMFLRRKLLIGATRLRKHIVGNAAELIETMFAVTCDWLNGA